MAFVHVKLIRVPSRDRLVDAFKYYFDDDAQVRITFTSDENIVYEVKIEGLKHNGHQGYGFDFVGRLVKRTCGDRELDSEDVGAYPFVKGFVCTGRGPREGWMMISSGRFQL